MNPLGKKTIYTSSYNADLLYPVTREVNREKTGFDPSKVAGYDVWNCYEVSWLNSKGKPEVRTARIVYPAKSHNIVESKSLKLYLGSFAMTRFDSEEEVLRTIKHDLEKILAAPWITAVFFPYNAPHKLTSIDEQHVIDNLDLEITGYKFDPRHLEVYSDKNRKEILVSNLLRTNCPITGQPDWGTVYIEYKGENHLDKASLLKYIISFRQHMDYHEACCEMIFCDLDRVLKPEYLIVKCFFTRRGGIDINPCRFRGIDTDKEYDFRYWRQ